MQAVDVTSSRSGVDMYEAESSVLSAVLVVALTRGGVVCVLADCCNL